MACNQCGNQNCNCDLTFKTEDTFLTPYIGGAPLEPIDLSTLIAAAESDTRLQLDQAGRRLVYTGERATSGDASADSITLQSLAELINLVELGDVEFTALNNNNLLLYNFTTGKWVNYAIPSGTAVNTLGVDSLGNIVQSLAAAPLPGSVEIPIGGAMLWFAPEADMPSNFIHPDGRELNRVVYADYYNLVGTTFGPGNGTTTFNVPNLKGKMPVGIDPAQTEFDDLGKTGGAKTHTLVPGEMPSHNHGGVTTVNGHHNHVYTRTRQRLTRIQNPSDVIEGVGDIYENVGTGGAGDHLHGIPAQGGNLPHNNMPPFFAQYLALRVQ